MKLSIIVCAVAIAVFNFQKPKVSAQFGLPGFYGGPLSYGGGRDSDDDLGILLAILLLAGRNRGGYGGYGGGNCGCCNCCNTPRTVPVPYPIPFPTNNPIITQLGNDGEEDDTPEPNTNGGSKKQIINFVTDNDADTKSVTRVKSNPTSSSSSSSGSSSGSASINRSFNENNNNNNGNGNNNNAGGNTNTGDGTKNNGNTKGS